MAQQLPPATLGNRPVRDEPVLHRREQHWGLLWMTQQCVEDNFSHRRRITGVTFGREQVSRSLFRFVSRQGFCSRKLYFLRLHGGEQREKCSRGLFIGTFPQHRDGVSPPIQRDPSVAGL